MIHYTYKQLLAEGFTRSQVHFSAVWLGRSPRYYSNLIATRREPGVATLNALSCRLLRVAFHVNASQSAKVLLDLAGKLDDEIFRRAIFSIPRRRTPPSSTSGTLSAARAAIPIC
ncbi:DUF6626 family protein [Aurantimonas sp. A2-1-M11]|uniref:DUF6626 family protein n=1 Tax=Aurantimonas sp. A2-1-M11 TaxID=3113712 RepID=UPI003FA5BA57